MFVLYQSPWLLVASGPGAAPETGWSLALIHQLAPSSPTTWGFGLNVQGTAVILAWSFQFYKPDLSLRLTLMSIPSVVYGADDDVRDKCLKTELGSCRAMAELRVRICFRSLRGWVDGEGKRQTKYMPDSLACILQTLTSSIGILFKSVPNAQCGFPKRKCGTITLVLWWILEGQW